jgi:hypothetical protein
MIAQAGLRCHSREMVIPDLIEAAAREGQTSVARNAIEAHLIPALADTRCWWTWAVTDRCRGLICDDDEIDRLFSAALASHAHVPMPFERARMQLCYGERLRLRSQGRGSAGADRGARGIRSLGGRAMDAPGSIRTRGKRLRKSGACADGPGVAHARGAPGRAGRCGRSHGSRGCERTLPEPEVGITWRTCTRNWGSLPELNWRAGCSARRDQVKATGTRDPRATQSGTCSGMSPMCSRCARTISSAVTPSPIAAPSCLVEPARTSPAANTPCIDVSNVRSVRTNPH